jgi:hypothetical protein
MNYTELSARIQAYCENDFPASAGNLTSAQQIATFVEQAEERIYNSVQLPSLRKNVTGVCSINNIYLACPTDFLSVFSMAVIQANGEYEYLLNKDVNFIRQSYPTVNATGKPAYYALFGPQYTDQNELSFILGPTPDANYTMELHYYYYPPTIVQGVISGTNTLVGGSVYTNGLYESVALSGGSGSNATADILISGNTVTSCTIKNGGSYYAVGDILGTDASNIGGTGSGFSIRVSSISNATGTSWLGDNFDSVLLYGSLLEAGTFMKSDNDIMAVYQKRYDENLALLKRLGDGLERRDAYRSGQLRIPVS